MKKFFWILFFASLSVFSSGSVIDTTIFSNELEKEMLLKRINDPTLNPLELFLVLDHPKDAKSFVERFDRFTESLKKETASLDMKKKLKVIYKSVHEEYFRQYKSESFVTDIFLNGEYNCVGASAFYSIILEKLNIPHIIKEKPDHVYIIADPDKTNFLIETTLTSNGLVQYDKKAMANFVDYLHDNKIIRDEEFKQKTTEALFDKYFLTDKSINIRQLAGLQYYNKGVFMSEKSFWAEAHKNFEKASILYPCELISYMKNSTLIELLNQETSTKDFHGKYLANYIVSNQLNPASLNIAIDHFKNITHELVINHPNNKKYLEYFTEFKLFMDGLFIADFENTFNFTIAYSLYTQFKFSQSLQYLKIAYKINPDNLYTRQLIVEDLQKISNNQNHSFNYIDSLASYIEAFPFIVKEKQPAEFLIFNYSRAIEEAYNEDNVNKGDEYLEKYEALLDQNQDIKSMEGIEWPYNLIATYFYKKTEYGKSIKILDRGIERLPGNETLKKRKKSIVDFRPESLAQARKINNDSKKATLTYKEARTISKIHKDEINQGVNKYLKGKWKIHFSVNAENHKIDLNDQYIIVTFGEGGKLITHESSKAQVVGTWSFDNNECSVNLKDPLDKATVNLLIQFVKEDRISAVVNIETINGGVKEIILTKVNEKLNK